jgi:hypothetical protein
MAYYRREWTAFVRSAILVMRHVFGLPWPAAVRASWLVLRAVRCFAPFPHNDPAAAQVAMERFYRLVKYHGGGSFDPAEAARLEVEWWHVHRELQHSDHDGEEDALADALAALYAHALGVPHAAVRSAAEERALAMRYCDQWVRTGCHPKSSLIAQARTALVRSYGGLLDAVARSMTERSPLRAGQFRGIGADALP